jgi:hypothetical protein
MKSVAIAIVVVLVIVAIAVYRSRGNGCVVNSDCTPGSTYCAPSKKCAPVMPKASPGDNVGFIGLQRGWFDIQGQGVAHDYCRWMGTRDKPVFMCALAGSSDPLGITLPDERSEMLRPTCRESPYCTLPSTMSIT